MNVRNFQTNDNVTTSTAAIVPIRHDAIMLDWAQRRRHIPSNTARVFDVLFSWTIMRHGVSILYRIVSYIAIFCVVPYRIGPLKSHNVPTLVLSDVNHGSHFLDSPFLQQLTNSWWQDVSVNSDVHCRVQVLATTGWLGLHSTYPIIAQIKTQLLYIYWKSVLQYISLLSIVARWLSTRLTANGL